MLKQTIIPTCKKEIYERKSKIKREEENQKKGIIKKEFGIKKAIKIVFNQFFIAYIISFLIYRIV